MSIFSKIPLPRVPRSTQNLSYDNLLTCNAGFLVPCYFEDALPGDKFKINTEFLIRTSPLVAPAFVRMDATVHFFKVPKRVCCPKWDKFRTGGDDPNDYTDITNTQVPVLKITIGTSLEREQVNFLISSEGLGVGSLADYLGFPPLSYDDFEQDPNRPIDWIPKHEVEYPLIPFISYQLIYDFNYRDQNYQSCVYENSPLYDLMQTSFPSFQRDYLDVYNELSYPEQSRPTTVDEALFNLFRLRKRAYRKDYFTSALPDTQKGPDVKVPLDGHVEINNAGISSADGEPYPSNVTLDENGALQAGNDGSGKINWNISSETGLNVNGGFSINTLRELFNVQRMFERNARVGSRTNEWYRGNFDVRVSDARLDQPEYLGGGITPIQISEILNTSGTIYDGTNEPLGSLAGRAVAGGKTNIVKGYCEEDCYIIGILSLLPRVGYAGGMPRMFLKRNRLDFFQPMFQNLGEQEVMLDEINYKSRDTDLAFGYVPRYSEYMYHNNSYHGDFLTSLRFWHLGRQPKNYTTYIPAVADDGPWSPGSGIIDSSMYNPNSKIFIQYGGANLQNENRIFNVTDANVHHFLVEVYNKAKYRRRMRKYSIPV